MIIGVTGTFASGKDTVADILKEKGFEHYSCGEEVTAVAKEMGKGITRDDLREIGNMLRQKYGEAYLVKRILDKAKGDNVCIAGIRQPGEADYIKSQQDGYLIAVDASIEKRFERMSKRAREGDPKSVAELKEKEEKEMHAESNGALDISKCMSLADFTIQNDSSLEHLHKETDRVLEDINSR